ncbi:MAG TPA: hypothetical protein ENH12_07690 [Proteobacteria bacterium]|nr:hypothetical protein [Pseudomonadota bacterium]
MNKKILIFTVVLAITALTTATTLVAGSGCCLKKAAAARGCSMKKAETVPDCSMKKDAEIPAECLCSKCGQIKGTEQCCLADAVKCPNCNLDKGSPGCCRMTTHK